MIRTLRAALGCLFLAATAPAFAQAQAAAADPCAAIDVAGVKDAVSKGVATADVVQRGLRSALQRYQTLLEDDLIGPVTTGALVELCKTVPLPQGTAGLNGAIELTRRYASIDVQASNWLARVEDLPGSADKSGFRRDFAKLAGPPAVVASALRQDGSAGSCPDATFAVGNLRGGERDAAERGLTALLAADPVLQGAGASQLNDFAADAPAAVERVCAAYGLSVPAATALSFAARLGALEARHPGAVAILGDPAFADWVLASAPARPRRMLGTVDAAALLLSDFGGPTAPSNCLASDYDSVSMLPADIARLQERPDLAMALKSVTDTFETSAELTTAVAETLGVSANACVVAQIKQVIEAPSLQGETFAFGQQALAEFKLDPELRPIAAEIEALSQTTVPDRAKWVGAMAAGVSESVTKLVTQQVEAAAAAAAQAAAEITATQDAPLPRFTPQLAEGSDPPPAPPPPQAPPPEYAVTGDTIRLLGPKLNDPELLAALATLPEQLYPTRDALKKGVELGLQDFADERREALEQKADAVLGLPADAPSSEAGRAASGAPSGGSGRTAGTSAASPQGAAPVVGSWRLTPEMSSALARSVPALAPLPQDTLAKLQTIEGISYPNLRLFHAALAAPPAELTPEEKSAAGYDRPWPVYDIALKLADETEIRTALRERQDDASVDSDCGCSAQWLDDTVIYSFYPFWDLEHGRTGDTPRPLLDFETIDRVAFHGLEIGPDGRLDTGRTSLWRAAGPSFVLSAHQHQAKADLSIRLRGWRNWIAAKAKAEGQPPPTNIKQAAADIAADIATDIAEAVALPPASGLPGSPEDGLLERLGRWVNQRSLSTSADGVTLLVDDYDGTPPGDGSIQVLLQLVQALSNELDGTGMTINIALDIPLGPDTAMTAGPTQAEAPLFRELRTLLLPPPPDPSAAAAPSGPLEWARAKFAGMFAAGPPGPKIDHVLVFLQRPTSEAKKQLRRRIEDSFQGVERAVILRKIVPVTPTGPHNNLYREERAGLNTKPDLQFIDDVVYFEDNFGGIGFWPSPNVAVQDQQELMDTVLRGFDTRRDYILPNVLRSQSTTDAPPRPSGFCDAICTNRSAVYLANNVVIAVVLGIVVLSYFSWRIDWLTRETLTVPILLLALFLSNVALAACVNTASDWMRLLALTIILAAIITYRQIARWRRGALP